MIRHISFLATVFADLRLAVLGRASNGSTRRTRKKSLYKDEVIDIETTSSLVRGLYRSTPLLLFVSTLLLLSFVVTNNYISAFVAGSLGYASTFWRATIRRRYPYSVLSALAGRRSATREVFACAVLSAAMWAFSIFFIFPNLDQSLQIGFLMMSIGSIASAASFLTLAPLVYETYLGFHVGAQAIYTALNSAHPAALSVLWILFGWVMLRIGKDLTSSSYFLARRLARTNIAREIRTQRLRNRVLATEKRGADALLVEAKKRALFVARICHEFMSPLQIIGSSTELLDATLPPNVLSDPQVVTSLRRISLSADQLAALSQDLAEYVRSNSIAPTIRPETFRVSDLVHSLVDAAQGQPTSNPITFVVHPSNSQELITTDRSRLHGILSNLITNAIRYAPGSTVSITLDRLIDSERIHFADNGPGIPEQILSRLFAPWSQGKPGGTGYGLGLSIVRSLSLEINAALTVASSPSTGTVFTLVVPNLPASSTHH